ncbi:MAG TPA: hypothetical protein VE933_12405 [Chitinophagaceae bacterium]|nr:hypothetical protein [Chitinophagaceae bacterium]
MKMMIRNIMIRLVAPGIIGLPVPGNNDGSTNRDDFLKENSNVPEADCANDNREKEIEIYNQ